ncbi:putative serine/threonine-protein kinase isoform X1, partial [Aphis craccivora]
SKVESKNNIKNDVKKNHVEDKNQGKKSFKEKNNEMVQDKPNMLVESNKKKKTNNIMLNSLCKTVYEDKEINYGDNVLESSTSAHKLSNKKQNQVSNKNINEKQNYNKSDQNQSKFSDRSFNDDKYDQKIVNDINNIGLHDTHKSINDVGEGMLEEIDEDLFKLSKDYSLAHCVAEDLRMGAGIAVDFKRIFGGVGRLVDQKLKIGDVGIVQRHGQFAFYLVTKKYSNGKPTMNTMEKALRSLFIIMKKNNLTKLGIPKIGCGLDKLDWSDTRSLIVDIFSGSGIKITVCMPSKLIDSKTPQRLNVHITPSNLWEMVAETIIVVFIDLEQVCKKNWKDNVVDKVDTKYPFKENLLKDVKNKKFEPGAIAKYIVKNEVIICIFVTQKALYSSLEDGFKSIDQTIKYYKYLAIQSGPIEPSDNFEHISWIVLILRSISHSCELWLCGDVNQTSVTYYDQYCKNVLSSMNHSFQISSPAQNNYKYNDNRHNLNMRETSYQNRRSESFRESVDQNSSTKTDT